MDRDGSGFLDPEEVSVLERRDGLRDESLPPAPPAKTPDPAAAREWMAKLDTDRDGRVSEKEYVGYMLPWTLWNGAPAHWHGTHRRAGRRYTPVRRAKIESAG